jgi:transcriptional regulator of arginine metabolism
VTLGPPQYFNTLLDFPRMKTQRHAAILRVIRRDTVRNQEQLRALLREQGFDVTQATLSRDIRELGLAKVAAPDGGSHYAPPPEGPAAVHPTLEYLLPTMLVSVDGVGPLLVLKTATGAAQSLGVALDGGGVERRARHHRRRRRAARDHARRTRPAAPCRPGRELAGLP